MTRTDLSRSCVNLAKLSGHHRVCSKRLAQLIRATLLPLATTRTSCRMRSACHSRSQSVAIPRSLMKPGRKSCHSDSCTRTGTQKPAERRVRAPPIQLFQTLQKPALRAKTFCRLYQQSQRKKHHCLRHQSHPYNRPDRQENLRTQMLDLCHGKNRERHRHHQ